MWKSVSPCEEGLQHDYAKAAAMFRQALTSGTRQGVTRLHIRAQVEQLQDTLLS